LLGLSFSGTELIAVPRSSKILESQVARIIHELRFTDAVSGEGASNNNEKRCLEDAQYGAQMERRKVNTETDKLREHVMSHTRYSFFDSQSSGEATGFPKRWMPATPKQAPHRPHKSPTTQKPHYDEVRAYHIRKYSSQAHGKARRITSTR